MENAELNLHEMIDELMKLTDWPERGKNLPLMIQCDHGQWSETPYSVQTFYRPKDFDPSDVEYGELEEMLEDYDEDELEEFIMIN